MRFDIAKRGNGLTYEIRNIVGVANRLKACGMEVIWENIGDPVQKGEHIPDWMKDVLAEILRDDRSYAYSPTQGMDETREFLADRVNRRGKTQITPDDILFFNGLGDAIARCYSAIRLDARVILPEPTYSTHFLAEVLHASFPPNTYRMNPYHKWHPDMNELEMKVKNHKAIVGILVINPDNPTGFVYHEETLKRIVRIAKENDLFLVFDETYINMVYNGKIADATLRPRRGCPGHEHERHLEGIPLARGALRLDRILQRRQGRDLSALHQRHSAAEDVRGVLDNASPDGNPEGHATPGI